MLNQEKSLPKTKDRRANERFDTALQVNIQFQSEGTPIVGTANEVGPNGMRLVTKLPLIEASYVLVSFQTASNGTRCEGRVVWTQRTQDGAEYESGIDIQRWGSGIPGDDAVHKIPSLKPKRDRRKGPR